MAPTATATPGRRKRENVFFQPGVQGRKTGITVKDTGRRDEHGFEPLDGIFSSPEKSPPKRPVRGGQAISSESMEIQQGSGSEPIEILSARRSTRSARVSLPPPKARSPIKTNLNSSPQRHPSLAPQSTARRSLGSPIRQAQVASVKRRINFNEDIPHKSIEFSPKKPQRGGRSSDAENVPPSDEGTEQVTVADAEPVPAHSHDFTEPFVPPEDGDSIQILEADSAEPSKSSPEAARSTPPPAVLDARRIPMNGTNDSAPTSAESLKRKRGRPSKSAITDANRRSSQVSADNIIDNAPVAESNYDVDNTMTGALPPLDEPTIDPTSNDVYSSPRQDGFEVHRQTTVEESEDSADEYSEVNPTKKSRKSMAKPQMRKKPGRPAKKSKPPKERDPNARPAVRQRSASKAPSEDGIIVPARNSRAPSKPRSLQILRQGTPLEEPGATKTRSGRQSIQPVAWWCGERINRDFDGTIKDVIRAETVDLTPKPKAKHAPGRPKPALRAIEEETLEDEGNGDLEPWEEEGGILTGLVKAWDSEYNMTIEDDELEMEIAFASTSIQTRDVMGANFSYAKLLTLPFFGAGVVDLPPGGFKRAKNSRKMQMIFFVHAGKALVTVGDMEFSISKGGAWQVPRGNFYSIENKGSKPTRIFFSQGYEQVAGGDDEGQ